MPRQHLPILKILLVFLMRQVSRGYYFSLGNFCFGGNRNPEDKETAVYEQTFTFVDHVMQNDISADIIPYSISSTTDRNDFRPTEAEGERKKTILEHMNEYSKPYSSAGFDVN